MRYRYDSLFKFYAEKYGLDWRLIKRQAEVESSLRPDAISPAGAVGLMQFMPATWREYGHGRRDNPEESIKAGCRYMSRLLSLWDEIPDETERFKFALASYNAGRQNIRLCTGEARKAFGAPYTYAEWDRAGRKPGPWQEWEVTSRFLSLVTGRHAIETINYVAKIMGES